MYERKPTRSDSKFVLVSIHNAILFRLCSDRSRIGSDLSWLLYASKECVDALHAQLSKEYCGQSSPHGARPSYDIVEYLRPNNLIVRPSRRLVGTRVTLSHFGRSDRKSQLVRYTRGRVLSWTASTPTRPDPTRARVTLF
jgi:hypothetical protein